MSNRYRKGITIIEVIVSLFLISIITVGFLTNLSNNMLLLSKGKKVSAEYYAAAERMENKIQATKTLIYANPILYRTDGSREPITEPKLQTYSIVDPFNTQWSNKIFSELVYYKLEDKIEFYDSSSSPSALVQKPLYSIVSEQLPPEIPVPFVTEVKVKVYDKNKGSITDYAPYVDSTRYEIKSLDYKVDVPPGEDSTLHVGDTFLWYISRKGLNYKQSPIITSAYDVSLLFPEQYDVYKKAKSFYDKITISDEVAGRQFLINAIPISASGNLAYQGQVILFISQLCRTWLLKMNYCCTSTQYRLAKIFKLMAELNHGEIILKWFNAAAFNGGAMISFEKTGEVEINHTKHDAMASVATFKDGVTPTGYFEIPGSAANSNDGKLQVYALVKFDYEGTGTPPQETFIARGNLGNANYWAITNESLLIGDEEYFLTNPLEKGKWYVISADLGSSYYSVAGLDETLPETRIVELNNENIYIGGEDSTTSNVRIGEVIITRQSAGVKTEIVNYLVDKYGI